METSNMHSVELLSTYMKQPLPSISAQKRYAHRTDKKEIVHLFNILNMVIFDNALPKAELNVFTSPTDNWGMCEAFDLPGNLKIKSSVMIHLYDKWYCKQWLINILAHEMCHQYQWDILGKQRKAENKIPLLGHGPSFFLFRSKLQKHSIALKTSHDTHRWFKTQNLFRC